MKATCWMGRKEVQVVDVPERHAGPGEVRLQVHAAAVNPTDTLHASGARAEQLRAGGPPPYVPGMDVAGVVDEVGEGVDALSVGDAVMAIVKEHSGAYGMGVDYAYTMVHKAAERTASKHEVLAPVAAAKA